MSDAPAPPPRLATRLNGWLSVPDADNVRMVIDLIWDANRPYLITLSFTDYEPPTKWEWSRALMLFGTRYPTGDGDIRLRPHGPDWLLMYLRSDTGAATVLLPRTKVIAFLEETVQQVSADGEELALSVELEHDLRKLLGA